MEGSRESANIELEERREFTGTERLDAGAAAAGCLGRRYSLMEPCALFLDRERLNRVIVQ